MIIIAFASNVDFSFDKKKSYMVQDSLLFAKLLELLANNHSLPERRIIFVFWFLKFSHVLVDL